MPAAHRSVFTGRMPFLPPNQQRHSTEGGSSVNTLIINQSLMDLFACCFLVLFMMFHTNRRRTEAESVRIRENVDAWTSACG